MGSTYSPEARVQRENRENEPNPQEETQLRRADVLPVAWRGIRITPGVREGVSPFEILPGKPYPAKSLGTQSDQMPIKGEGMFPNYLLSLSRVLSSLHGILTQRAPLPLDSPVQEFQPGDSVGWLAT